MNGIKIKLEYEDLAKIARENKLSISDIRSVINKKIQKINYNNGY